MSCLHSTPTHPAANTWPRVTNTTRGWADGVRSTGNNVKDATTAGGPRAQTAQNPLGLTRGPLAVQTDRYAKSAAQSRAGGAPSSGGSVKFF